MQTGISLLFHFLFPWWLMQLNTWLLDIWIFSCVKQCQDLNLRFSRSKACVLSVSALFKKKKNTSLQRFSEHFRSWFRNQRYSLFLFCVHFFSFGNLENYLLLMEGRKGVFHKRHFCSPFVAIQSRIKKLSRLCMPAQSSGEGKQ